MDLDPVFALLELFVTVCTVRSAAPFEAVWYGGTRVCLIPLFIIQSLNSAEVNCGPLSDTTSFGNPYDENNLLNNYIQSFVRGGGGSHRINLNPFGMAIYYYQHMLAL